MEDEFIETEFDGDIPEDICIKEQTKTVDTDDVKLKNYIRFVQLLEETKSQQN